jgi:hypothetical protein
MLKNGKFIKEPPVKIGVHYVPPLAKHTTEEEALMQQAFLRNKRQKRKAPAISVGGFLLIAYLFFCGLVVATNLLVGKLFG